MGRSCCAQFQSLRQQFYRGQRRCHFILWFLRSFPLCATFYHCFALCDILSLFYCAISVPSRTEAVACPIGNMVSGQIAKGGFAKKSMKEEQWGWRYFWSCIIILFWWYNCLFLIRSSSRYPAWEECRGLIWSNTGRSSHCFKALPLLVVATHWPD